MENEKESPFKVGDKVFDISFGWGIVTTTPDEIPTSYSIVVVFEESGTTETYTKDGRFSLSLKPSLSFKEYGFNSNFTQERPLEVPPEGTVVYVWSPALEEWLIRISCGVLDPYGLKAYKPKEGVFSHWEKWKTQPI